MKNLSKSERLFALFFLFSFYILCGLVAMGSISLSLWMSLLVFFVFAVFAFFYPREALSIFVVSSFFEIIYFFSDSLPITLRPYQLFAVSIVFSGFFRYVLKREKIIFFQFNSIDIGVVLLGVGSIFSSLFSPFLEESIRLSIIMLSFIFIYGVVRWFVRTKEDIYALFPFLVVGFLATSLWGILQNIAFLWNWSVIKEVMPGRPNGFFSEPDWFGFCMALASVILAHGFLFLKKKEKTPLFLFWIVLTFVFTALIISVSRSAWLASFFGLVVLLVCCFWEFRKRMIRRTGLLFFSFFVAVIYVFVLPLTQFELGNRLESSFSGLQEITISCLEPISVSPEKIYSFEELQTRNCRHIALEEIESEKMVGNFVTRVFRDDPNVLERKDVWKKSFVAFKEYGFWGVGWGSMEYLFGRDDRNEILNASNIFLNVYIGAGFLGFLGFMIIIVSIFLGIFHQLSSRKKTSRIIGCGVFSTLAVVGVFNFFNSAEFLGIMWIWLGLIIPLVYERYEFFSFWRKR